MQSFNDTTKEEMLGKRASFKCNRKMLDKSAEMRSMIIWASTKFWVILKQVTSQVLCLFNSSESTLPKFGEHLKKWNNLVNYIGAKYVTFCVCLFLKRNNKAENLNKGDVLESPPVPHKRKVLYLA